MSDPPAARNATSNSAIGRSVLRIEDGPLVRGDGRFVDDLKFAGMLEAAFVRSPHAHAGIRGIDATRRSACPACTQSWRSPTSRRS